ncbi:MAG: threonylcarbamoyl-AMP synthase [Fimbriimonadaceae bacterium]|nr:threonylcarbamoyl-AMP synthase [Fimbriimonadaceae bacterium]
MSVFPPTPANIAAAARVIQDGGAVVMPTETVYGLACDALDEAAVARVYEIKGRPAENPLIVHLASHDDLERVAVVDNPLVKRLADAYWPGPLTMVLKKSPRVPRITTAGLDTVAVRVPSHPVARELIRAAKRPLAAPSANVFMGLSPTRVEDLDPEIRVEVEIILDGGPCEYGLESTVVDVTGPNPVILRPGAVTRGNIQALLGRPLGEIPPAGPRRSPGLYPRHYAPRALLKLVDALGEEDSGLTFGESRHVHQVKMPRDAQAYAANMYSALKKLDTEGVEVILVERPPADADWEAVNDRLKRACD